MAISEQWAELLEPGLREIFEVQKEALAASSRIPMLFNVIGSQKAAEHFLGAGAMNDWAEYKGVIPYDDLDQLYKTTLTHKEYAKGFTVERKLVDDDQYGLITPQPRQLALAAMRTREKHAASIFNNAFSSSYAGGDAVELCDASHPLAPTHSTDTQSNIGTSALSADAITATRQLMRAFTDDRSEIMPVNPDTLLVPAELEDEAQVIVQSQLKPGGANNDFNYAGSLIKNVIVWDYLTDANNWFLIDSALAKQHLLWIDRVGLEFALDPAASYQLKANYRGYMRYSYGFSDYRWVYGHSVT
jgi:phage major head subunit gpT-like protein